MIFRGKNSLVYSEPKHASYLARWKNSKALKIGARPTSANEEVAAAAGAFSDDKYDLVFNISGVPSGFVQVCQTNKVAGTKDVSVFLENERADDFELCLTMVAELEFKKLRTSKLTSLILANQQAIIKTYEKAGWAQEVRRRQHALVDGKLVAVVQMGFLEKSFATHKGDDEEKNSSFIETN